MNMTDVQPCIITLSVTLHVPRHLISEVPQEGAPEMALATLVYI